MENTYKFYSEIARGLTNDLLLNAFGIAYYCWQTSGERLEENQEVEAYRDEINIRLTEEQEEGFPA